MRNDVEFKTSDGLTLRGWHYPAKGAGGPAPIIVMVHGFSSVKEMRLDIFAQAFATAGLGVLVYDHRNFGDSEGMPRQEIDPWHQLSDIRDAITFASTLPGADRERIGFWGTSYAGGHAFVIGATDRRVKCVVAQVPFTSGNATLGGSIRPDILVDHILPAHAEDRRNRMSGGDPATMPVVDRDPMAPAALASADSWSAFHELAEHAPNWVNAVTLRSLDLAGGYEPAGYIHLIAPTPLLMVIGRTDTLTPTAGQIEAYSRAREPKRLVWVNGGHFQPYLGESGKASVAARDWFLEHLGA